MGKVMKFAMSLSLLCTEVAPPEHIDHANHGGISSLLGTPKVTSGRKPLKLFKQAPAKRQLPALDRKRVCHCLFALLLLGFALYVVFAMVLPRLQFGKALQVSHFNNSTMI